MNLLILVVDDEPDVEVLFRQQFRRDLRADRFTMEFAQSRPRRTPAHHRCRRPSLFILILSDINMPGMSGLELLPQARAARPDVPVIMITAYGDAETKRKALEGGAEALWQAAKGSTCQLPPQAGVEWRNGYSRCDGIAAVPPGGIDPNVALWCGNYAARLSCETNTLPLVSGPSSKAKTNTRAAPTVETSIGTAKPPGWVAANRASNGPVKPPRCPLVVAEPRRGRPHLGRKSFR